MHYETMKGVNDLVSELKVMNVQFTNVVSRQDKLEDKHVKLEDKVNEIKNTQEGFKPFIKLVESINTRIWVLLLGGIVSMGGAVYMLMSKIG